MCFRFVFSLSKVVFVFVRNFWYQNVLPKKFLTNLKTIVIQTFLVILKSTWILFWRDVGKVFEPNKKPENILRQSWIIHATFTLKQEQFKRTHETDNKVLRRLVCMIPSSFFVLVFGSFKKQTEYCCWTTQKLSLIQTFLNMCSSTRQRTYDV